MGRCNPPEPRHQLYWQWRVSIGSDSAGKPFGAVPSDSPGAGGSGADADTLGQPGSVYTELPGCLYDVSTEFMIGAVRGGVSDCFGIPRK